MLQDLLTGVEKTSLILVTDNALCPGRHLLLNWIDHLGTRCDKLILVCFERHPDFFKNWLPLDVQKKMTLIDGRKTADIGRTNVDLMADVTSEVSRTGGSVGVVIDSVSMLLLVKSTPITCSFLHNIAAGSQVTQVVALLHRDVHDQNTCRLLEHVAPTVVEMASTGGAQYTCCIRHCRPTGKVLKSREYFYTDDSFHIYNFGSATSQDGSSQHKPQDDLTSKLPFNLSLTDAEKDARSKVKLPYLKDGSGDSEASSGRIFYQPDDVDDFDEEDPDDDLDI
ncbi:unnamed protein product [Candidula unifasciata]|uniref:Elongator complex protein 5 n=1 Tax=Candidula unifasciata TaxID=100452 RepID=A0A8S4ACC0_9EUPU|nr:unnamed protein product [Candidula unifasciata]